MDEQPTQPTVTDQAGVSRRRVLQRIGVGAAVAWSVPVVSSLASPAAAAGSAPTCSQCSGDFCFGQTNCATNNVPPTFECPCAQRADGNGCFCYQDDFCSNRTACPNGNSDCPNGQVCVHTCCDAAVGSPVCWTPCGTAPTTTNTTRATSGPRGAKS